jgi:hypothetical protein
MRRVREPVCVVLQHECHVPCLSEAAAPAHVVPSSLLQSTAYGAHPCNPPTHPTLLRSESNYIASRPQGPCEILKAAPGGSGENLKGDRRLFKGILPY